MTAGGFVHTVTSGSLLLALPVAVLAGLVSFLSPCVLPLVPGYLSYVTGMSGADLARDPAGLSHGPGAATAALPVRRFVTGRVVAGSLLFVLGFTAVFVSYGALFGGLGSLLREHQQVVSRVLGGVTILLGLAFLGVVPGLQRDLRVHRLPAVGLAGAPLVGVVFGLGWTPCIGPTLGAVTTLAYDSASAGRGALLSAAYCFGLGLPFVLTGVLFRRAVGVFAVVRSHYVWVMRIGGGMLVLLGLLMVTGLWDALSRDLVRLYSGFTPAV